MKCIVCKKPSKFEYCPHCLSELAKENGIKVTEEKPLPEKFYAK